MAEQVPSAIDPIERGPVTPAGTTHRFPAFDAMRGIAAVLVMLFHLAQSDTTNIFQHCYLAVDFFFMLSGFVLGFAYDERLAQGLGTERFLKARVRRLWPTIAAAILLGAIVASLQGTASVAIVFLVAAQFCFVPVVVGTNAIFPLNSVQWSLLFELIANAAHGSLLHRLTNRTLAIIVAVAAIALFWVGQHFGTLALGDRGHNWLWGLVRSGFAYPAGLLLFRLWRSGYRVGRRCPWFISVVALPALLLVASVPALRAVALLDPIIVALLMPPIVWLAATATVPARWHRASAGSGALSYPLYAFHLPVLNLVMIACSLVGQQGTWPARGAAVAAAVTLSWWWASRSGPPLYALRPGQGRRPALAKS